MLNKIGKILIVISILLTFTGLILNIRYLQGNNPFFSKYEGVIICGLGLLIDISTLIIFNVIINIHNLHMFDHHKLII